LEKRSSAPPNPPAGLVELLLVVAPTEGVMGEALVQPPKSSSAATVGAGLGGGAPQPLPMSLAVRVSGTFIMDAVDDGAGAGAGAGTGSGLLQALPPQGSIIPAAAAVAVGISDFGGCCWGGGDRTGGLDILKAELISCCGDVTVGLGGATGAAGAAGGEERPKRSLESEEDGGLGLGWGGGEENPPNPKSCEFDEIDVVRD